MFYVCSRELVAEWVSILRVQLRQLRVFQAPINVYSRAPRPKLSLPAASQQAAVAGGGPRDPTSPLPAPPVVVPTTESHSPVTAAPVSSSSACQRFSFCSAAESSACGDAAAADYSCPSVTSCTCSAVIDDCTGEASPLSQPAPSYYRVIGSDTDRFFSKAERSRSISHYNMKLSNCVKN